MIVPNRKTCRRTGGVYIAVLGTSIIVALLGISALLAQRIQNRITVGSADIRQAELNANAAVDFALLQMKQNAAWRTAQPHGSWGTRTTGAGTCNIIVTDPRDANLANSGDDHVLIRGTGYYGSAQQSVEVTVEPRKEPLSCLRSAIAAGGLISLNSDTLRTGGLITANQISVSSSQVYGSVEATSISGSTYYGARTQVTSDKLPTMPDWSTVFDYYKANGTQLNMGSIATTPPSLDRNGNIESGTTGWAGTATGTGSADLSTTNNAFRSAGNSLRVRNRSSWMAGASQGIESFVEPGKDYYIEAYVYVPLAATRTFRITLYTKGTGNGSATVESSSDQSVLAFGWRQISGTLTAQPWSGNLDYAFVKIAGDSSNSGDFYLDDFVIREALTGSIVYRKVLGPGVNTLYNGAPTNANGLYWINCNGSRLVITRSRIVGTLLILNPGSGSCIPQGPISWTPSQVGFPAILVDATNASDADFSIQASNRALSEAENGTNFNPTGAAHETLATDNDLNDVYASEIRGLIAVRDDLTFANRSLIRGQIIVGDQISTSSGELEVEYLPDSLLNPPQGFTAPYTYWRRPASLKKAVQ